MSQATNACLYYGFDFYNTDECEDDEQLVKKFDRVVDLANDCKIPKKMDITIDCHQSSSSPVWFVAVTSVSTTARRGHPQDIDILKLAAADATELNQKLKEFCHKYGIPWQTPGWRLASFWEV